jgi:hypothetical protein
MTGDIPPEIMAAIEQDVERYRQVRINAALRRLQPEYLEKAKKRADQEWVRNNRDEIVRMFAAGQSLKQICGRVETIKPNRIRREIRDWLSDALNRDYKWDDRYDEWKSVPRFSEELWRSQVNECLQVAVTTQE